MKKLTPFLLVACMAGTHGNYPAGEILFSDDFDSGVLFGWDGSEFCCDHSITVVDDPTRAGAGAVRFEIRRDDPLVYNGIRSELKIQGNSITGGVGDERWYGFSILVPTTWISEARLTEIIVQWHANSDEHLGEGGRSPPLYIEINGDLLRVRNRWDPAPVSPSPTTGSAVEWEGPLDKGVWIDWVFHVHWSYEADGLLEVWKDGTKIVEKYGPNTFNDVTWLYFKMGLYNWNWTTDIPVTSRVIFHDEVRVAAG